ncbi:PREDICTED: uncharacterized protein LOC107330314 [Acropora digitifera]|uniref:uncharacterized protein LOC107330314 n=1 Tax=Acropora digitifera TaxID=70779 RepID=UPI00077A1171|nr:PREDICTED: uncharacterized protein LOC107330314 [Acropora digitifera]
MASDSTSIFHIVQCNSLNSLPQLKSNQTPFGRYDELFGEERRPLQEEFDLKELKALAAKDKKLGELIPQLEAQKRAEAFMRAFLQKKAKNVRQGRHVNSDDDGNSTHSDNVEVMFPVILPPVIQRKMQLTRIESRSFIHKLWLRRIELTREESNEASCSSLADFEHAIRNAQESIKRDRDFIYKEFYNKEEVRQMNSESLEKTLNKVLEEKEKSGFEMIDEDIVLFVRPTVRLCALLGLKLDFLDRLKTFPEDHFYHRSLCDWITIFLQNNSRSVNPEKKTSLTLELLDSIGFDPSSTAVKTIMARSSKGNTQCHIEACEWAEIFIQDECTYNPLISSLYLWQFPFRSALTDSCFKLPPITDDKESKNDPDPCHVNIMNFVTKESQFSEDIHSKLDDFLPQSNGTTVLYHGTDHHSAVNILLEGIDLSAGRQNRDFSSRSGFYLTKNMDEAINWALSTTAKPAILVFQVKQKDLNGAKKLDLSKNEKRWCEIVTSFRSGRRTATTRESVNAYDLIEGPQATVRYDEATCELLWEQKPSSNQVCLVSEDFAEQFQKTLHSILFLDVSST